MGILRIKKSEMKNLIYLVFVGISLPFLTSSCGDDDEMDCIETLWYQDADSDGLCNSAVIISDCEQPTGYVSDNTDIEDNCTGTVDECGIGDGSRPTTWWEDKDGFGNSDISQEFCTEPEGFVSNQDDADDTDGNSINDANFDPTDWTDDTRIVRMRRQILTNFLRIMLLRDSI